jgi:hypothetical protein
MLPRVPWLLTLPPCSGGLRRYHVPRGSGPCLPAQEGSGAAMCPAAPDPASLLERDPVPPRSLRLQTLPPCLGGFRGHDVPHGFGP